MSQNCVKKPWIKDEIANKIKRKQYLFKRYKNGDIPYSTF